MSLTIMPTPHQQFLSNAGAVLASGFLYTFAAGTDDDLATYSDEDGTVENANPILLNSAGRPWNSTVEVAVFLLPRTYKFVLKNSAGTTIWTADHIPAVPTLETALDITGTAGEAFSIRDIAYLSAGDGGRTAGRWYKTDADNDYASSTAGMVAVVTANIASGDDGTFRLQGRVTGYTALSSGADYFVSATAGEITVTAPVNERFVGQADSTTSLVVSPNPASSPQAATLEIDGTAGEALAAGDLVYLSDGSNSLTAGRWYKADADFYYASIHPELGFAPAAISSGALGKILIDGTITLSGLTAGVTYFVSASAGGVTATAPMNARSVGVAISTTTLRIDFGPQWLAPGTPLSICDGRLTLTSGTPVTTADVTGATSVYFAPYTGNRVALFDGSKWKVYPFAELTGALGTLASGLPYDVFLYDNAGTLTLQFTAWTNSTTRATALATQNGVLSLTGSLTRRFLGTFYTTSTTATEDSFAKRFLSNYYNRVPRALRVLEATDSWTYTLSAYQQANNSAANQLDVVVCAAEVEIDVTVYGMASNGAAGVQMNVGIGEDGLTLKSGTLAPISTSPVAAYVVPVVATLRMYPAVGRHYYTWLERSEPTNTTTWRGDANQPTLSQAGITGEIQG